MFLHSGAGLHGHGYSPRLPSSPPSDAAPMPPPTRYPLLRSALLPRGSPDSPSPAAAAQQGHQPDCPSPRPSLDDSPSRSSLASLRYRTSLGGIAKKDLAVRFREPQDVDRAQTLLASDDESLAGSELSDATDASARRSRRNKRLPRKSTQYALALPAPQLRTKQRHLVQIRPRLLLQLQRVGDRRAIPAFDVVPSSLVAGTIIIPRLAKRFPRMFRAKPELGQDDVLLVRSDDYGPPTPASSLRSGSHNDADADDAGSSDDDADRIEDRDVLAVISALPSQGGNGCAEIVLEDGSTWLASSMASGSFEFTHVDNRGCTKTARWARRRPVPSTTSTAPAGSPTPQPSPPEPWWTFSIMDPESRRHPVMGSLTTDSVEVYDTYNTLSASSGRYPPSRPFSPELGGRVSPSAPRRDERATVEVTPEEKSLMLATAAWIGLHQRGWPASANPKVSFRRTGSHRQSGDPSRPANCAAPGRRPLSFPAYDGDGLRNPNVRLSWPQQPESLGDAAAAAPAAKQPPPAAVPKRSMSTGRAFMKRRSTRGDADAGANLPARTMSTGRAFMKRRITRGGTGAAADSGLPRGPPRSPEQHAGKGQQQEKTHTYPRVWQWMQKLFHLKKGRAKGKEGELVKCKLEA